MSEKTATANRASILHFLGSFIALSDIKNT